MKIITLGSIYNCAESKGKKIKHMKHTNTSSLRCEWSHTEPKAFLEIEISFFIIVNILLHVVLVTVWGPSKHNKNLSQALNYNRIRLLEPLVVLTCPIYFKLWLLKLGYFTATDFFFLNNLKFLTFV